MQCEGISFNVLKITVNLLTAVGHVRPSRISKKVANGVASM